MQTIQQARRRDWITLAALVLGGFMLRWHQLGQISLWFDELNIFNSNLFRAKAQPLFSFVSAIYNEHTLSPGWPALVWFARRIFGPAVSVAGMPSVLAGTRAIAVVFLL